ncbi:MAG: ankyrin repeat domain-containing protein [Pontiella sp.]
MKSRVPLLLAALLLAVPGIQAETNTVKEISPQEVVEAALYGKIEIIEHALKQGFKVNTADMDQRTPLMFAAFNAQIEIIELLIEAGADINAQDQTGTSALMFAASAPGAKESIQVLLDAGAAINLVDKNEHFSALMWAAAEGQAENVKLLLAKGADLSLLDIDGDTAETFAAKAGHSAVAQLLQEAAEKIKAGSSED